MAVNIVQEKEENKSAPSAPQEDPYRPAPRDEELSEHNILILGAANRFASHIAVRLLLNKKNKLTIFDRKPPETIFLNPDMKRYEGDYRISQVYGSISDFSNYWNRNELKSFDTIINCLHIHDSQYSEINPLETHNVNETFTSMLMETLRYSDFNGRLIHIGTDKVYGVQPVENLPIKEDKVIPLPNSIRGKSRYNQETTIRAMSEQYGIKYIILRFGTTYGEYTPDEKAISMWITNMLQKQNLVINGEGRETASRDWLDVYDASMIVKQIAEDMQDKHSIDNQIYNIGGVHKYERFLQNIAEEIRHVLRPLHSTPRLIYGPWRNEVEEKNLRIWLDCTKAEQMLNYHPIRDFSSLNTVKRMSMWIAVMRLDWDKEMMIKLKRTVGIFDSESSSDSVQASGNQDVMSFMNEMDARLIKQVGK